MSDIKDYASIQSSNSSLLESNNNEVSIRIMQYNVQMLISYTINVNWWRRGSYVIDHVLTLQRELDIDVIVFNEVFLTQFYQDLQKSLFNLFPYSTPVVNGKLHLNSEERWKSVRSINGKFHVYNGGVIIFSKYPIVETHQLIFNHGNGIESLVSKGAVLAKILKNGKYFNVVGTHFQSGYAEKDHLCRMKQGAQLARWIKTGFSDYCDSASASVEMPNNAKVIEAEATSGNKMIPLEHMNTVDVYKNNQSQSIDAKASTVSSNATAKRFVVDQKLPRGVLNASEPLIFAGDFNIRYEQDEKWLLALLDSDCLNAQMAINKNSHLVNTYDSSTNDYCKFVNGDNTFQNKDILDYFFLSKDCAGKIKSHQKTITQEFAGDINLTKFVVVIPVKHVVVHHPSDHYPIVAEFSAKSY